LAIAVAVLSKCPLKPYLVKNSPWTSILNPDKEIRKTENLLVIQLRTGKNFFITFLF
jgi:hypothetical protein